MMERIKPNIKMGLSEDEVKKRISANLQHRDTSIKTKPVELIIYSNLFTLFNILNLTLGLFVFYTGEYKNLLFLGVVVCNTIISMTQELHAKRIIDKLSIISSTKVKLIRSGKENKHHIADIVIDDIIKYEMGDQIIVDSIIQEGSVEVDESFITGEADSVTKTKGELILSGSFIVSGNCTASVEHISDDNYINKISKEAKYIKKPNSEIFITMTKIIKVISIIIIPVGLLLFLQQSRIEGTTLNENILSTVAALIGMIPEGLILLTSTVLAVGAIRLAKHKVLIQQLHCIETLARVDTVCLDKTGTITTGKMEVKEVIPLDKKYQIDEILVAMSYYSQDNNATAKSLKECFKGETNYKLKEATPFSSVRKYSGMEFDKGKYLIGAPEFLTKDERVLDIALKHSDYRVLLLVGVQNNTNHPIALILIRDIIRNNASETLQFFYEQDVDIKIISGDNVKTIENIASNIGMRDMKIVDMSKISKHKNLEELVLEYNIFGRVTPSEKKELILALKANKKTVAMTGDGVNDVLALREADCSMALSCGSDAAKSVSQLVMLDSDFASIPKIVNEGRRVINNLERSATLFLTKTIYSTLIVIFFLFASLSYPFEPIQLSLISVVAVGVPSFILALEPNNDRVKGNFIINVILKSIPAALTIFINIVGIMIVGHVIGMEGDYVSTMGIFLVAFTAFQLLFKICYPFNHIRGILFGGLIGIFLGGAIGLRVLFEMVILTPHLLLVLAVMFILDVVLFRAMTGICEKKIFKHRERIMR